MTQDALWRRFEKALDARPIDGWEFLAPRSHFPDRRDLVYKLFLRPGEGSWWLIEDGISQVPANYPDIDYRGSPPMMIMRGSANLLEFLRPEPSVMSEPKPALTRAFAMVHDRLALAAIGDFKPVKE